MSAVRLFDTWKPTAAVALKLSEAEIQELQLTQVSDMTLKGLQISSALVANNAIKRAMEESK